MNTNIQVEENEKKKRHPSILIILFLLSIVLVTMGVSFAFFEYIERGNTVNYVETGNMIFRYDESNREGNGIRIVDAFPITDAEGKVLTGSNQTFDFQVYTNIVDNPVEYQIVAVKQDNCTLEESDVKVYLTQVNGSQETPVRNAIKSDGTVLRYSDLEDTDFPNQEGQIIYRHTMTNHTSYTQDYRLRMWIAEDVNPADPNFSNKVFSIKVNVYARSV